MPNHVINEIIFRDVDPVRQKEIVSVCCGVAGDKVDFEVLLPIPLNVWRGSVGVRHEQAFGRDLCGLDWARVHWGTKWNAYDHAPIATTDDTIIFRFQTAWRPPYGWIVALFNRLQCRFEHNWLSDGGGRGTCAVFDWSEGEDEFGAPWSEAEAPESTRRHLHKLLWGVEAFGDGEPADA